MKILVYGAGVIGCELAHMLIKAGQDVTLFARGAWRDTLEQKGLVIRHYAQLKTTTDRVRCIDKLAQDDVYDLIFVVMQYVQLPAVLPILAENRSRYVVFVGNNAEADETVRALERGSFEHETAFGFQGTAGRREKDRVVSIHAGVGMTVGALHGQLSEEFKSRIEEAFRSAAYRLSWNSDMDAWLKCHLVLILPVCYVCYALDCDLTKSTKPQRKAILDAALEGCRMLREMGADVKAEENDDFYTSGKKRRSMELMLYIMAKTTLGKLAASDHCKSAVKEMTALDAAFEGFRERTGMEMPAWESLRERGEPENYKRIDR